MKILVSFSGGKDSQACLIQAFKQYGGGNLTAVFCDTGWEHPDTYKHVNDVCLQMGVRLITLKSKYDFVSLAVHKKRFPSTNARFCTSELKMKPMIDYVLSLKESCIIIQGIRAGESTARAAMEEECMYFKSYFQPNKKGRTENYRSKDVKEWCSQFDASVLRPIFKWSAQQVIDCILDAGQKPNPLYYRGFSRVGCFPCIMCRHKEIELIAKNRTEMKKILIICVLFALIAGCASPRNQLRIIRQRIHLNRMHCQIIKKTALRNSFKKRIQCLIKNIY